MGIRTLKIWLSGLTNKWLLSSPLLSHFVIGPQRLIVLIALIVKFRWVKLMEVETYVHNWDCCSTPSSPKGRRILQCPVRFYWTSHHRLRRNTYASETGYLVRRWRNKPTTRSSNSRHLCTAGGCRRAPSRWDRHSRTTAGNRVRRKSLCVVADLRRTGVNIPSILTIQTNRLPYSLNLFGIKEKV
jgi:hypothetical protein